ncbi:MAG: hypothetical protein AAFQ28_04930 [Pseudomonadota bacterium]
MNETLSLIEGTASQRELSLDAWTTVLALNLDQPANPGSPEIWSGRRQFSGWR